MYEKWYYFQSAAFILREITNYFVSNDTSYSVRIHTVCMLLELETNLETSSEIFWEVIDYLLFIFEMDYNSKKERRH